MTDKDRGPLLKLLESTGGHGLCVECGPISVVDEDGCCQMCGGIGTGSWLLAFRKKQRKVMLKAREVKP